MQNIYKFISLSILASIFFIFTHCGKPTVLEFQEGELSGKSTSSDSLAGFASSVYPITRANCVGCHTQQQPTHAHPDIKKAHDSLIISSKINLQDIGASRLISKVREGHNCWGDCNQNAEEMRAAIEIWARSINVTDPLPDPGETTGMVGGTDGGTTGLETTGGVTGSDGTVSSLSAYQANLYPISRANCIGCHTAVVPQHASDSSQAAHDASLTVVDFINPAQSRILAKLKTGHNCGTNCNNLADQYLAAIVEWKKVRDSLPGTTVGGSATGGVTTGGTTSGGTTTGGLTTGGTTTGGSTTGGTGVVTSLSSYQSSVYVVSRTNCIGCHTTQSPRHASNTPQTAHDAALNLVNFTTPQNSRFVSMMNNGHNCGTAANCTAIANSFIAAIGEWKKGRDQAAGTTSGGTTSGGTTTGGTTTGGTTTGGTTGGTVVMSSLEAYKITVYPISRTNCISCHTTQSPRHASNDPVAAHSASLNLTNFTTPQNSRFVSMMNNRHNCGTSTNCTNLANQFINSIREWKTKSGR